MEGRELQVLGAEIVSPLGNAVGLVDGEKGQFAGFVEGIEHRQGAVEEQTLGGDIDQIEGVAEHGLFDGLGLAPVQGRIEAGRPDAGLGQRIDLVLHEGDERRDDDSAAGSQQGRNLVAEAFAAAGGHEHQGVAAVAHMADDLLLATAEGWIAEDSLQDVEGRFHGGVRGADGEPVVRHPRPGLHRDLRASRRAPSARHGCRRQYGRGLRDDGYGRG